MKCCLIDRVNLHIDIVTAHIMINASYMACRDRMFIHIAIVNIFVATAGPCIAHPRGSMIVHPGIMNACMRTINNAKRSSAHIFIVSFNQVCFAIITNKALRRI